MEIKHELEKKLDYKKYILLHDEYHYALTTNDKLVKVYRIKALRSFGNVHKGDLGGFVQSEQNLSHEGNCWVADNAKVYENARIIGSVLVNKDACINGNACIYGTNGPIHISDNTVITKNVIIGNDTLHEYSSIKISGDTRISGNTKILSNDNIKIHDSIIFGDTEIHSSTSPISIKGNSVLVDAHITKSTDVLIIGPIGSRNSITTFYHNKDKNIMVRCGCFYGTIREFEIQVKETHEDNEKYLDQYLGAIAYVKSIM